jgi:hypothetical protein
VTVREVRYGEVVYRLADQFDDGQLRTLLRENDMQSWVSLSFQREPDYFRGEDLMGASYSVLVHRHEHSDQPMGMYSCSFLPVKIDGRMECIGYLGNLRVGEPYRHSLRYVKQGFQSIQQLVPHEGTRDYWFTSIATGNDRARRLLEAGLQGLPKYTPIGNMLTTAMAVSQGKDNGILQVLTEADIEAFVSFYNKTTEAYQFSPWLTVEWMKSLNGEKGLSLSDFYLVRDKGDVVACVAIWDQRAFKQTVVHDYANPLRRWRRLYNLFARVTGRPLLPGCGDHLQQVYLSFVACDPHHLHYFVPMVRHALNKIKDRGACVGVLGLSTENPLLNLLKQRFHMHSYESCIEQVCWSASSVSPEPGQPVQPEVAVL